MAQRWVCWVFVFLFACVANHVVAQDTKRGQYIAKAGGCVACHTDSNKGAVPFAGGRALKTPFGVFYGPNITPHPEAGIGRWREEDFIRAMRMGVRPDGAHYFPAFPYTSFTKIGDQDLHDLWAYLRSLPASARPARPHELKFPFNLRSLVAGWKWLYFKPGPFVTDPKQNAQVNLGAYLVQALGHCGECHTPRNLLGAMKQDRFLAGGKGPEGKDIPNITPTGLKKQSDEDLKMVLTTGLTPDGDVLAEAMGEVVQETTSQLSSVDLSALIAYLRSLPALPDDKK